MVQRYLVFRGDEYYPSGGWGDFLGSWANLEDARKRLQHDKPEWWHIVDIETGKIIEAHWCRE